MWAFGVVLRDAHRDVPFEGRDGRRLSRVLKTEPDWNTLPDDVSPTLVLQRCLDKDRSGGCRGIQTCGWRIEGAFDTTRPHLVTHASMPRWTTGLDGCIGLAAVAIIVH